MLPESSGMLILSITDFPFLRKRRSKTSSTLYVAVRILPGGLFCLIGISYERTKNVPWHILAPAAVACDIYIVRRSAHLPGGLFCLIGISYETKKAPLTRG